MNYTLLRNELREFYWKRADGLAKNFFEKCEPLLNEKYDARMSPYEMKVLQYKLISETFEPVLFINSPFYYETGTMAAHCDGAGEFRGHIHAGSWTYRKNRHKFTDQDPALWELRQKQKNELFYLICGPYNDTTQHYNFNHRPIFKEGLSGIFARAVSELEKATNSEEKEFLGSLCEGLLCLKRMGEKFSEKALEVLISADSEESRSNLTRIAETAKRVPWKKPKTFFEALNTYAFLRKALGALEGVGFNSFGRVDIDLYPFYKKDIENGILTPDEAYSLICRFLITFDTHYDHDMKMVGYADHEFENTYVLGGCDENGTPVFNELTDMFLRATREEKIIYPKIKCRFGKNSPKEYLDEINRSVVNGTSTVLYQNDDATIPALLRSGRTLKEARDYIVAGCWDVMAAEVEKLDNGAYVNLMKPFEFSLHLMTDKMSEVGMTFEPIDNAESFDDVYATTLKNIEVLFRERARISRLGGNIFNKVSPLPLFSSTLKNCIESRKDYTAGGAKYRDDHYLCFGFPNIIDSLLSINELCFVNKKYTLAELLTAVRCNWEGYEIIRAEAMRCHGWGDGSEESCALAARFHRDLYEISQKLTGTYGGRVELGYLTYTEIRFWGEKTLATPDGRRNGDYFSQGLTPSRLKKIASVTDVINSLAHLDGSLTGGNSVVNIILPNNIPLEICEAFLRVAAKSAMQSLQLNCTSREQLLDAQKHPEKYPDLIVRVAGFSAKFTSLSPEWQNEVLTRNFYN